MVSRVGEVVDFDHHGSALTTDGPAVYRALREKCPVAWTDAHGGYWVASSYDAVSQAARDDEAFSSDHDMMGARRGYDGILIPPTPFEAGFMEQDPPDSLVVRRVLNPLLSSAASAAMVPQVTAVATRFIDEVIEAGTCDFVDHLATPIPAVALFDLIGLPAEEWEAFAVPPHVLNCAQPGSPAFETATQSLLAATERVREIIAKRMADRSGDDVLGHLCRAEIDGQRLSETQLFGAMFLLWTGGVNTTTAMLAATIHWLSQHPSERDRLRENSDMIPKAVDEFLRAFSPITGFARTSTRDQVLAGQEIAEGDRVFLLWASANRDPKVFEDPDTVDLDRNAARQCAFGIGSHRCVGAGVAKTIFTVTIGEILQRMPDFRVLDDLVVPYNSFGTSLGYKAMPFEFTPGVPSAS